MRKVQNKKTIRRLAMRSYHAAGARNRIAVTAIALTTILFTSLFTIGSGAAYSIQRNTVRQSGGDGHAVLKYITDQEYQDIRNHPLIREISYNRIIADSVDNPEFLKRRVEMYYMDDTGRKLGFCEPSVGRTPEKENEIITDTRTLELLNVPKEIGTAVPLTYTAKGKQHTEEFTLSGYWESDPVFNVGFVIVSKAFLDSHRNDKGVLSAEDDAAYTRMEQEITDLGKEIARLERQEALEAELNRPVNKPLTGKPMSGKEETKTGRATDEYRQNFWNMMRSKAPMPSVVNALQIGTDSEGGYLVPDEYERTLVEALEEENVFRQLARVIQTSSGDRKIPVVATKGTASWIDEEGAYTESDDSFGQVSIGAYKLGTMIKVSEELLNDSVFDLESYISREFARRIGAKEEEAFFTGDGSGKPLGILAASGGAETGITAASATAITADELIDLFYSLKSPYRRNAVWVLNDSTIKAVRKLKDGSGQYLWQPSLTAGTPDTILGRPVRTSAYMPAIAASAKTIAFGDFSYYWIADRQGRSFKRLNELYAANGQVGFLASQRVDGKMILPEAVKVLVQKAS
mgnify:CR=1 FL=1